MPGLLVEASEKLQREFSNVFNAWLHQCVEKWCPEALEAYQNKHTADAVKILIREDFHYACLPGNVYEFRQGDIVLARCKIEWTIKSELKETQ